MTLDIRKYDYIRQLQNTLYLTNSKNLKRGEAFFLKQTVFNVNANTGS